MIIIHDRKSGHQSLSESILALCNIGKVMKYQLLFLHRKLVLPHTKLPISKLLKLPHKKIK